MSNTGPTAGQRIDDIKASIPGTQAYEARHGYDQKHANMQNLKSHIPGTAEHQARHEGVAHTAGTTTGTTAMPPAGGTSTGAYDTGAHHTGAYNTGATGAYSTGATGVRPTGTEGMTTGEKIMSAIPGTAENREKRVARGDAPVGGYTGTTGRHY